MHKTAFNERLSGYLAGLHHSHRSKDNEMRLGHVAIFVIRSRESFCNLIGAARFHAVEVQWFESPNVSMLFSPVRERINLEMRLASHMHNILRVCPSILISSNFSPHC